MLLRWVWLDEGHQRARDITAACKVAIADLAPTPATQGGHVPDIPIPDGALISKWWWFFTFTQASESEGELELTLLSYVTRIAPQRYCWGSTSLIKLWWMREAVWLPFAAHMDLCEWGSLYVLPIRRPWWSCTLDSVHVWWAAKWYAVHVGAAQEQLVRELQYLMQTYWMVW